jgi:hypothetical protein
MAELLKAVASWPGLLLVVVVFGFAPGFCLRLIVLAYPRNDHRRAELIAELYIVPGIQRPLWVVEQLEVALFEGLAHRVSATIYRLTCWRQARTDRRPFQPGAEALYDRALAAFWTERWDQAIVLLEQVLLLEQGLGHCLQRCSDVAVKLELARDQQQRREKWTTPGSLEASGSGKDQGHGNGSEVPGGVEGTCGGDGG